MLGCEGQGWAGQWCQRDAVEVFLFSGNGGVGRGPPTFLTSALPWSLLPSRGWSQVNRGPGQGRWGAGWGGRGFILAPGPSLAPSELDLGLPRRDSQSGLGLGVNSLLTPSLLASTNPLFPGGLQNVSFGARTCGHPLLVSLPSAQLPAPSVPGVLSFSMPPLHPCTPVSMCASGPDPTRDPAGWGRAGLLPGLTWGAASLHPFLPYLLDGHQLGGAQTAAGT